MVQWAAYKGKELLRMDETRDPAERIEVLRKLLQEARAASERRLIRATQSSDAVRRHERTYLSQKQTIKRQGDYIEMLKLVAEVAADAARPDIDEETRAVLLADLRSALDVMEKHRVGMGE